MAEKKSNLGKTIAVMSGMGSFLMSIFAIIGVVVYQTNSNTELKTEVGYVREAVPLLSKKIDEGMKNLSDEVKESRQEIRKETMERLKEADQRIADLQKEVNDLKVRVKVLESTGE